MIDHMDAREYLGLAVRLNGEIDGKLAELSRLHELVLGAPPGPEGGRTVEKLMSLAEKVSREIDEMVDLKDEIRSAIDAVISTLKRRLNRGLSCIRPPDREMIRYPP